MKSSREAILMSKLGNKKGNPSLYSVDQEDDGRDFRGIKEGVKDPGQEITAKTGGSLGLLKAARAGSLGSLSSTPVGDNPSIYSNELEENPSLKAKPYSPIKNYLRKGK